MKKTKGSKRKVRKTRRIKGGASQTQPISPGELFELIDSVKTKISRASDSEKIDIATASTYGRILLTLRNKITTGLELTEQGRTALELGHDTVNNINNHIDSLLTQ